MKRLLIATILGLGMAGATLGLGMAGTALADVSIGVLVPDSGPAGLFGPSARQAAQLAAEDINAEGGINGEPVEACVRRCRRAACPGRAVGAASLALPGRTGLCRDA